MALNPKICNAVDMIDASLNWSLDNKEKDKKIAVYHIGLQGIPDDLIDIGLVKQLQLNSKEFPTPGQFRELCKPAKRPELLLLSFEESVRDNELNQKNCVSILKKLGFDISSKGKMGNKSEVGKLIDKQIGKLSRLTTSIKKNKG